MIQVIRKILNNKSRKGEFIYLKEKGQRGRYIRPIGNVSDDLYKYIYENKITGRALQSLSPLFIKGKEFSKNQQKLFKRGKNEVTTSMEELMDLQSRRRVVMDLISPLINNTSKQKLVLGNIHLLRGKFSYFLSGKSKQLGREEEVLTIKDIGSKSPDQFAAIYGAALGIKQGKLVSNQDDFAEEVSNLADIHRSNVHVTKSGVVLNRTTVKIHLTV